MEASEDFKLQRDWVARIEAEIRELDSSSKSTKSRDEEEDFKRRREKAQRLLETDRKNVEEHESSVKSFLQQAISMYAHYMEVSNEQDEEVAVRFCGLWFAKFESDVAAESIRHALQKISTHKLLFLSHQLTARLGTGSTIEGGRRNQRFLHQLVEGMCLQHPYHSLLQVLTAKGRLSSPKRSRLQDAPPDLHLRRQEEAKKIIESVRNTLRQPHGYRFNRPDNLMEIMEEVFRAYVEWSRYPIKEMNYKSSSSYTIPKSVALHRWTWDGKSKSTKPTPLPVPVVTASLPIDISGRYLGMPTIQFYRNTFTPAGGMHVPKITACVDTLGKQHRQLVGKGAQYCHNS